MIFQEFNTSLNENGQSGAKKERIVSALSPDLVISPRARYRMVPHGQNPDETV